MIEIELRDAWRTLNTLNYGSVKCIYIDPPFYTQKDFGDFSDRWVKFEDYISFMTTVIHEAHSSLSDDGAIFIHCDHRAEHIIFDMLCNKFGEENYANTIYTMRAPKNTKNVVKKLRINTDTLFFFWKDIDKGRIIIPPTKPAAEGERWASMTGGGPGGPMMFGETLIYPPDGRHFMWSQKHINESWMKGEIKLNSNGNPQYKILGDRLICGTLWNDIPAYSHSTGYSTEKHTSLLERIILMVTNENDVVCDPMCGSGPTAVVCKRFNRNFVGGDINQKAVDLARKRVNLI